MESRITSSKPLTIGIVGAGFSGTALAAALSRQTSRPLHLILIDKSGEFGVGDAYRTPYPFHLLNVRAKDMSAFETEPGHFVNWLTKEKGISSNSENLPVAEQFVSRCLYREYLAFLINNIASENVTLTCLNGEVLDVSVSSTGATIHLEDERNISVDKIVLALGHGSTNQLPITSPTSIRTIENAWEYEALKQIPAKDSVAILGTGLSMIDAVLTLHHQGHAGMIYAVSRHGLLPLSHSDVHVASPPELSEIPSTLRQLTRLLRDEARAHVKEGGDWRSIINAIRAYTPHWWEKASLKEKKQFLRHLLPYWNIHRHRVHPTIAHLLDKLSKTGQLQVIAGRMQQADNGRIKIKKRHAGMMELSANWMINCLGPTQYITARPCALVQALVKHKLAGVDALRLGFTVASTGALKNPAGEVSTVLYTLGAPLKGEYWECTAVPEIRKQTQRLSQHLLI